MDFALRRLHLPEDFVAWTHEMLIGQQRVMSTAYGTEQAEAVARLEGGVPQGDPASPGYWVIVLDFVLTYVATAGGAGYKLYGVAVQMSGYADDLAPMSATREGLQQTVAATMAAVGVITVRVNEVKSYYVRSPASPCDEWAVGQTGEAVTVPALDMQGSVDDPRVDDGGCPCNLDAAQSP